MATIVIEDGSGLSNSNSYATEAELTAYADDRGQTTSSAEADLLIIAMDYIEQQPFKGTKNTKDQALQWPRYGAYIDGFPIDTDEIPQLLKDAQMEAALAVDAGNNPSGTVDRSTKREKLGDMEIEYTDGSRSEEFNRALEMKLSKLIKSGSAGISAVVIRG